MNNTIHYIDHEETEPTMSGLEFRVLTPADAKALMIFRLQSLVSKDGKNFEANIENEAKRSIDEWRQMCVEKPTQAIFGAFKNGQLIGTMSARNYKKDYTGSTAYYHSAFMLPKYRGGLVTSKLAGLRDDWAEEQGYTKIVSLVRFDNLKGIERQMILGGKITDHSRAKYTDGKVVLCHMVERSLLKMAYRPIQKMSLQVLSA